jgi:putative addiction module component (TIGR02574 family)
MTSTIDMNMIRALPVPQRVELAQQILDSISADPAKEGLDEELFAELNRRVAAYRANPSAAKPWEDVKASLRSRG